MTEFGQAVTPNEHNLALQFVTLDRFLDTAEVSFDGWLWSTAAQAPDMVQKEWPVAYGFRGLSDEAEGLNRKRQRGHYRRPPGARKPIHLRQPIPICCRARPMWPRPMGRITK